MADNNTELVKAEFDNDSQIIGKQTDRFLNLVYPSYLIDRSKSLDHLLESDSSLLLDSMTFFRIACCSVEDAEDLFESVNDKIEKLFTALHSISIPVGYGIVSRDGVTNLVLCVYSSSDVNPVKKVIRGMLSGIELEEFSARFKRSTSKEKSYGILSGVPSVFLKEKKQTFSLSSIMRTLNGEDYTLLFLAKPVHAEIVKQQVYELINIKDSAFAISKRNLSRNTSLTGTDTHTVTVSDTKGHTDTVGGSVGGFIGIFAPPVTGGGSVSTNYSHSFTRSHTEGFSDAISKAITDGESIAIEIQNGFALELMNYADKAIERLKSSQNNGIWQTAICYSANSEITRNIIKACLCGELSKPDPDRLSLLSFEPKNNSSENQELLIPKFLQDNPDRNPLCSYINSSELGLLCTMPTDSVPDFELRIAKQFPLIKSRVKEKEAIGYISDGKRRLENMPFGLTSADLNKHTFVSGITGSGKSTTVKRILINTGKPFMVIEAAKKEYRNIPLEGEKAVTVYTLGKPEINCPQINPFYIMPGVSPQSHIDFLKDLFIASFSFYGPMPYILEKCLHNIYKNKGWNLTLGFHPLLVNTKSIVDFFDIDYVRKQYRKSAHRYLFPTMQELKDEIERYVKKEMDYEGEVAGNIKTAIKVRLDNLCVGAKGYMFNTYEHLDMPELLEKNSVFELEGLADDSDKAFCVGLMVIFIKEYRQTIKETQGNRETKLLHLLVIEEAHRLLKNVDTERSSENVGNPKGKAVEHFTNMIAEMRSYGQGVIVAEQIPSRLAPDVIKNSSNKIIQRIVSDDDQQIIANTIGISTEDSIQLGTLETGYALCHKEGMALPVFVNIDDVADNFVSDELLYNSDIHTRMLKINLSMASELLNNEGTSKSTGLALLNTVLSESVELAVNASEAAVKRLEGILKQNGFAFVLNEDITNRIAEYIVSLVFNYLVRGVYAVDKLPDDEFEKTFSSFILSPSVRLASDVKNQFALLYGRKTESYSRKLVSEQIRRKAVKNTNIKASIREFFIEASDNTVDEITQAIKKGMDV